MFQAVKDQMRKVALLAIAAALVVGGVAAAQSGSGGGTKDSGASAGRPPVGGPPPMMGIAMKGLTYAELHVQTKDGEAETLRIDQGKIKSADGDSITLVENDDSEVTIAVDDDTQVLGRPGEETGVEDLQAGQQVSVTAPQGEAAQAVMVMPKKGDMVAAFHGGPAGPPPGAPAPNGSAPGGSE